MASGELMNNRGGKMFETIFNLTLKTVMILGGLALAFYLAIYVMLAGGIIQAIDGWGDTSAVTWGIIKAIFFELGLIPGAILVWLGIDL